MSYSKYRIKCPYCGSDTFLLSEEFNPIMYPCNCCNRFVIAHKNQVFTVKEDFFIEMSKTYNMYNCGQVVACACNSDFNSSKEQLKNKEITEEDLKNLHDFLLRSSNSSDIIEKL